jgi:hypothetical protein
MVSRRRPSTITVPAPRRIVTPAVINLSPFWVGIVAHGKHRSGNAVEQFRRSLGLSVTTARNVARAYEDWSCRLAR